MMKRPPNPSAFRPRRCSVGGSYLSLTKRFATPDWQRFGSLARLQQASVPAVTTLLRLMVGGGSPATVKARCAYYILDQTRKGVETENIEKRVTELERAAERSEQP